MIKLRCLIIYFSALLMVSTVTYASSRQEYTTVYGRIQKGNLTITSFSSNWVTEKLHAVYEELMKNTVS